MKRKVLGAATAALFAIALLALAPAAPAAVIGHLDVANCSGGGVIVTANSIDWIAPVGMPNGCIQTGSNTNITYTGGTLGSGQTGSILDLTAAMPFPVTGFMTFSAAPGLYFDLSKLGPGPTSTACTSSFDPNSAPCAAFAGSPFQLQATASGTSVTLSASGVARDMSAGTPSTWIGAYTTQISGVTPAQVQATINAGGSEQSTYSGDFVINVSAVPEPATVGSMLLGGLLLAGASLRRKLVRK